MVRVYTLENMATNWKTMPQATQWTMLAGCPLENIFTGYPLEKMLTGTGETRHITSHITCNTTNLIYMIQWNRCHLQYISEIKRRLKDRFNKHRRSVDKTNIKSKPTTVSEHFLSHPNHHYTDMQLIPLELIHSSRDSIRKARESFLIDLAGTLKPHGLNRRDELWSMYTSFIISFIFT